MTDLRFESSVNIDPGCLQRLHAEYRGLDPDGTVTVDSPLVEQRGVMHENLRPEWFADRLNRCESHLETAWIQNQIIGFCLCLIGTKGSSLPQLRQIAEDYCLGRVGYVAMICVTQSWTRKRVGEKLLDRSMEQFDTAGVDIAVAEIASKPRKNIPSMGLFRKAGWIPSGGIQLYRFGEKAIEYEKWVRWSNGIGEGAKEI